MITSEIISGFRMNGDYETDWFPMKYKKMNAVSLEIGWKNVAGSFDGEIEIYVSNDTISKSLGEIITIDSSTNEDNNLLLILNVDSQFIKLYFRKNNIVSGELTVNLAYK